MAYPVRTKVLSLALLLAACSSDPGSTQSGNPPVTPGNYNPNPPNNPNPGSDVKPPVPGQTDFTTEEAGGTGLGAGDSRSSGPGGVATGAAPPNASPTAPEAVQDPSSKT